MPSYQLKIKLDMAMAPTAGWLTPMKNEERRTKKDE